MATRPRSGWLIGAAVAVAAGCGAPGPRPLGFGTENCAQCHMTLADPRFAAELVWRTGKVVPFDDPGCLATFLIAQRVPSARVASLWVSDFLPPHDLLEAREAVFLVSDAIHTPMDHRIAALRKGSAADSLYRSLGGRLVSWDSVLTLVGERGEEGVQAVGRSGGQGGR